MRLHTASARNVKRSGGYFSALGGLITEENGALPFALTLLVRELTGTAGPEPEAGPEPVGHSALQPRLPPRMPSVMHGPRERRPVAIPGHGPRRPACHGPRNPAAAK